MSTPLWGDATIVAAGIEHLPALQALIVDHGANVWNYLPEDGIRAHIDDIAHGRAHGVLALDDGQILGAVTFGLSSGFDRYLHAPLQGRLQGYVNEAVVRRDQAGRGLGTRLLKEALATLATMGVQTVFIDRHEENRASAGMMRRAGFVEVETYPDPRRRTHGSGRTTVCCFTFAG
ncbi:MAG: N-acetyltransferase family protein [Rhodoferax sp.]